ncbi:MAG: hypothetical protein K8G78_10975, partial [Deltaproteobacteria bacterium]|nr:hypothetical protein [Candidatus Kapabacteria bacterium]
EPYRPYFSSSVRGALVQPPRRPLSAQTSQWQSSGCPPDITGIMNIRKGAQSHTVTTHPGINEQRLVQRLVKKNSTLRWSLLSRRPDLNW